MPPNKRWTQSYSGKVVVPTALTPEAVSLPDIAHALSLKCRFQGQTQRFYSVGQHCVEGARLMPTHLALAFLLHEVSEVYLPDIPGPMKDLVRVCSGLLADGGPGDAVLWSELEAQHADAVLEALGLTSLRPLLDCPEVKAMDWAMLAAEKRDLLGPEPEDWNLPHPPPPGLYLTPWPAERAEQEFKDEFTKLTGAWGNRT